LTFPKTLTLIISATLACSLELLSRQTKQIVLPKPLNTTLCEILGDTGKFNGKLVRFQAKWQSDMHWSVLTDPGCGRGIVPVVPDEIEALDDALNRGMRGTTMDKQIVGTFTGKFVVKKDRSSRLLFTLEISKIENLEVTMIDLKPHLPQRSVDGSQAPR
jgi:hypothetical protein